LTSPFSDAIKKYSGIEAEQVLFIYCCMDYHRLTLIAVLSGNLCLIQQHHIAND